MTAADDLAAVVAGLRPVAEDLAFPDTCQIKRKGAAVTDSRGNKTYPEVTAATVRCLLKAGQLRPDERAVADQVKAIAPYVIALPYTTNLAAPDILQIGTRRFDILGVLKTAGFGVFTTAIVEERT